MLPLRSLNHNEIAYVQFQNRTHRSIDIIWVDYNGDYQKYITLKPTENINIDTYETHPWIFIDRSTGLEMRVGSKTIFYPLSNNEVSRRLGLRNQQNLRVPVAIKLPLFTLRQISMQTVMNLLKNDKDVESLELPLTVIRDIKRLNEAKLEVLSKY